MSIKVSVIKLASGIHVSILYVTYRSCDVGAQLSQSGARNSNKKTAELVFYPVDSSSGSSDLAFSVNLRRIAKHYVHDERVRNALTAKADEHLTHRTTQAHDGHKGNGSTLDSFLSRGQATQSPRTERSGKRSHAIPKPVRVFH